MRRNLARMLLGGGVIVTTLSLSIPAALAATWTVSGGTSWSSSAKSGTTFTLSDTTSNTKFTCTAATGKGTVKNGKGLSGTAIGKVTAETFGSSSKKCTGPLGSTGTATGKTGNLNALSYSSSKGQTTGTISSTSTTLSITDPLGGGTCTAVVTGTAGVLYTNSSGLLQFTTKGDSLTVASATGTGTLGCAGLIKKGDKASFTSGSGGETVTPKLKITSP